MIALAALLLPRDTLAAPAAVSIVVDAAVDYGPLPKYVLGKCYSESGVQMLDAADKEQMASLGTDCLIKRWGRENLDIDNRANRILRTLAGSKPGTYATFYGIITAHKKQSGDKFEFLEFANEPDYQGVDDATVYRAFRAAYTAAYDYNQAARPAVPVKVGGPGDVRGNYLGSIATFLDRYKADADPKKSLGFISCHLYGDLMGFSNRRALTLKRDIAKLLKARGLPDIPIFITESSCFGAGRRQGSEWEDMLKQASYMAVRDYYLVKGGFTDRDANFHWTTRNRSNARKSMLDFVTKENANATPGVATPYLNMLKMELMLKGRRIYDGECNADGWGLSCFATRDGTGIAVMLINCQQGRSPEQFNVAFTLRNLSSTVLNGKSVRVEKYLIDASHNHCRRGYDGKTLEKFSDQTIPSTSTYSTTERLGKNAVELIVLSPQG